MKRTLIILGALSVGTAYSQSHKVGINTDNPRASLEVSKAAGIAATEVQGLLLPQLTQAERNGMDRSQFVQGLQIYNTDKNCVDIWNGNNWQCIDGTKQDNQGDTPSSPSAVLYITQLGFSGVYKRDEPLSNDNAVTFNIKNTGTVNVTGINLSGAVTITNEPGGNVYVVSGQHSSVTIAAGREVTLTYRLLGTPKLGSLKAKLTHNGTYAEAVTNVSNEADPLVPQYVTLGSGERSFVSVYDKDYWPYSGPTTTVASTLGQFVDANFDEPTINIQGKITTTGTEVYIPITVDPAIGSASITIPAFPGSEIDVNDIYTEGQTGKKIKLSWEAQSVDAFSTYIKAKISAVDSDYLIKRLDFQTGVGKDFMGIKIGEFTYAANQGGGIRGKFIVRIMSGIPDRKFAEKTNGNYEHQFIYVPVKDPVSNYIWLNNNLGAEYTNMGSSLFDPGQQAKEHGDYNAFGSLFQWGRPADGHELVAYTSGTTYNFKYPATNTLATTYPPGHSNRITPPISTVTSTNITLNTSYAASNTVFPNSAWSSLDNDNAACPTGFRVATASESIDIISRYKATDNMKDLYVRLPSSIAVYTDYVAGTRNYYNPKLWGQGFANNDTYNHTWNGKTINSIILSAYAVDLRWDPAQQKFYGARTVDGKNISSWDGEVMWFSPGTFPYSFSDSTYPDSIDRGYGYSNSQDAYTEHAVSSQMPIRCIKQ